MNKKGLALLTVAVLAASAIFASPTKARADFVVTDNPNPGVPSAKASPDPAPLGGPVSLTVCAGGVPLTFALGAGMFAPGGGFFAAVSADHPAGLAANKCHTWVAPADFPGMALGPGSYIFVLDTTQTPVLIEFAVSFFVLPESPIGAVAILGSSLAALGAFVGLRQFRTKI